MGCIQSRCEKRNTDLDDYNTLDIAFMGGEGRQLEYDICPVDKITLNYMIDESRLGGKRSKEVREIFKINNKGQIEDKDEAMARGILQRIIHYLESLKKYIEKDKDRIRDFKKVLIGQKFTN